MEFKLYHITQSVKKLFEAKQHHGYAIPFYIY